MPNDNIMGIPTKACINGITKDDALEIKKIPTLESETNEIKNTTIPSLDERITALEQGGGGSEWFEIDVSTFTKAQEYINDIFYEEDGENYLKYNMILVKNEDAKILLKDTNIFDCFYMSTEVNAISNSSNFTIFSTYTDFNYIFYEQPNDDEHYLTDRKEVVFNPTDSTFNFTDSTNENSRTELKILIMGYNPE